MAKENKNLKKLAHDEMQGVSGGKIFVSNGLGDYNWTTNYFVAVPQKRKVYQFCDRSQAIAFAKQCGVDTHEYAVYETARDALAAAQAYATGLWNTTNMDGFLAQFNKK